MRSSAIWLFILLAVGRWCLVNAQMDEKPPVLKRGNSTPTIGRTGKPDSSSKDDSLISAGGVIKHLDPKVVIMEADDARILTCKLTASTAFLGPEGKLTADDFDPGMRVQIKARMEGDSNDLTAVSITLEIPTQKPTDLKTSTAEGPPDEEGRPVLRRGKPTKRPSVETAENDSNPALAPDPESAAAETRSSHPAEPAPAPVTAEWAQAAFLKKVRDVTAEYTRRLPNFVCKQFTTRYERESRSAGWEARDVITAALVYQNGIEEYQNIKIGNKAAPKNMMDAKGQTTTGDFNSVLASLMEAPSNAEFHYVKDAEMKRLHTKVYDFAVKREGSNWSIKTGGQSIIPAYSGRLWIDRESGRVVRLERQADKIPVTFPMDTLEQTVDYDFVLLGERKVLLPTESESLSCQRGSSFCAKNVIEFRNYQEFRGESKIDFDK